MATYYRWRKSTISKDLGLEKTCYDNQVITDSINHNNYVYISNAYKISGYEITLTGDVESEIVGTVNGKEIFSSVWYTWNSSTRDRVFRSKIGSGSAFIFHGTNEPYGDLFVRSGAVDVYKVVDAPGTSRGYVYSTSSSAYPNGGVQGGYYYDQRTTVESPTAPTGLTYPNPITTPTVTVSWNAATSNTDYPVSGYCVSYTFNDSSTRLRVDVTGTSTEIDIPVTYKGQPVTSAYFAVYAKDSNGQSGPAIGSKSIPVYLAPTLSVPSQLMQGQQATINWTAISGADSYTLQRKANTDADWTQVYSGANLSYTETVGTWTSLQYRVQAVFSGTPGGWAESAAIPVVSSSALVISGTDGDLGTVVNDIPYSISTDTGNQITATITVNSAVIFSGNVGNSTADVIPVLDLVNGTGTIVIEASVQATSGPVSAVRTWTYTKTMMTFPNAGSIAELTKDGKVMWPETLAEAVRIPGGKTLDQVMGFPCQMYIGSYVGTGAYGTGNPNELTFPFEPKIIIGITPEDDSSALTRSMIRPNQQSYVGSYPLYVTWDGNSVSWYSLNGGTQQLNRNGKTYYYVALG